MKTNLLGAQIKMKSEDFYLINNLWAFKNTCKRPAPIYPTQRSHLGRKTQYIFIGEILKNTAKYLLERLERG